MELVTQSIVQYSTGLLSETMYYSKLVMIQILKIIQTTVRLYNWSKFHKKKKILKTGNSSTNLSGKGGGNNVKKDNNLKEEM